MLSFNYYHKNKGKDGAILIKFSDIFIQLKKIPNPIKTKNIYILW